MLVGSLKFQLKDFDSIPTSFSDKEIKEVPLKAPSPVTRGCSYGAHDNSVPVYLIMGVIK